LVSAWGAGGAGSSSFSTTTVNPGGGGGYVNCKVTLPRNKILYLTVGGGGTLAETQNTISRDAYGGGGNKYFACLTCKLTWFFLFQVEAIVLVWALLESWVEAEERRLLN
jgi:hypothetical protein